MSMCKECHETPCICGEEIPRILPKPLVKDDPIRWDFSQRAIEQQMWLLNLTLTFVTDDKIRKEIENMKDDWQRKIDWNIREGNWK